MWAAPVGAAATGAAEGTAAGLGTVWRLLALAAVSRSSTDARVAATPAVGNGSSTARDLPRASASRAASEPASEPEPLLPLVPAAGAAACKKWTTRGRGDEAT